MRNHLARAAFAGLAVLSSFAATAATAGATETTLVQFSGDPWAMSGNIIPWQGGVLGTAGGSSSANLMSPPATRGGAWTSTRIYSFSGQNGEGAYPADGVVSSQGLVYGVTSGGGNSACPNGCGTVFALTPPESGATTWTETQLYVANQDNNGYQFGGTPHVSGNKVFVTTTHAANDTTRAGDTGPTGGTVLELTQPASGTGAWTATVIHHFDAASEDGDTPFGGLISGPGGVIYGTTFSGGACNQGTVYELTPPASRSGTWTETLLHQLGLTDQGICNYNDGELPVAALTLKNNVLYGTTRGGAISGCGTAYMITLGATPAYQQIYSFGQGTGDACSPQAPLQISDDGVLYGTTVFGGSAPASTECSYGCGTVFTLTPQAGGSYSESVVYSFTGGLDGSAPRTNLLGKITGQLKGVASYGGLTTDTAEPGYASYGTLFRIKQ